MARSRRPYTCARCFTRVVRVQLPEGWRRVKCPEGWTRRYDAYTCVTCYESGKLQVFATLLETYRQAVGLSKAEVSRRAGISQGNFSKYILGYERPSRPRLLSIIDILNIRDADRKEVLTLCYGPGEYQLTYQSPRQRAVQAAKPTLDVSSELDIERRNAPLFYSRVVRIQHYGTY